MCRSMAGTGLARAVSDSHGSGGSPHGDARGWREALCCLHEAAAKTHTPTHTHRETKMCTCSLTLSHSFLAHRHHCRENDGLLRAKWVSSRREPELLSSDNKTSITTVGQRPLQRAGASGLNVLSLAPQRLVDYVGDINSSMQKLMRQHVALLLW